MVQRLAEAYYRLVLRRPLAVVAVVVLVLAGAGYYARYFELDASSESLMLEDDAALETYRAIRVRYGSDDALFVTFTPTQPLFSEATLASLAELRDELATLEHVESVTSVLDVPLLHAEGVTFDTLDDGVPQLSDPGVSPEQARRQLVDSPIYRSLLIDADAETTALVLRLAPDERLKELAERRRTLREQRDAGELGPDGRAELAAVERAHDARSDRYQARLEADIAAIRAVLERYRDPPTIHLGGVPMIAVDMIDFVASDIRTFGVAVAVFIVVLLAAAFRRPRWVLVPVAICAAIVVVMVGWLGLVGWPVTVVSSNFISLVLIITLSLIVHLIVRYRELHAHDPGADQHALLRRTIDSKFKPSFFTALTTGISFGSLMFADIRPVIDFGLMMVCSVVAAFVLTFALFPALLAPLAPRTVQRARRDPLGRANVGVARRVRRHRGATGAAFAALFVLGVGGALQLTVENRFIDYFHDDTEIHQGMKLIDRELGGTTPLDVVVDAPAWFVEEYEQQRAFAEELGLATEPNPADGYWYNARNLEQASRVHDYLDGLEATGKVLSMATIWDVARHLNGGEPLEPHELGILYNRLPDDMREQFIERYMTPDGMEVRFDIRVIDTLPGLNRDALIERVRRELPERFELEPEQVTVSGMLVLYNNVMQSLFRSQLVTLAIVFGAIMVMFGLLYRSLRMAVIGPIPTVVAAALVLGIMGWVGLPLDIMTMTIAAIVIGIGVDDTIHYVDRYQDEIRGGADDARAAGIAHGEVGRAMVYTTVIITLGFSILTLSNFMPTIYFGLLTGLAMIFALVSNLALLPALLARLRPPAG